MSYSLNCPCFDCTKKDKCTDRASIAGAISGIHCMPYGVGHLGAGSIDLNCINIEKEEKKDQA
jgi:hypothetical protein